LRSCYSNRGHKHDLKLYAVETVLNILTKRNILATWDQSGLYLFTGHPPIERKEVDEMLREKYACEDLGVEVKLQKKDRVIAIDEKQLKNRRYKGK